MLNRIILVLCISVLVLALFYVYSNILMLDDYHPKSVETMQDFREEDKSDVIENSLEKSETENKKQIQKKGYHIHINLDEMMMYVYRNGELKRTYPVSGGARSTPSPVGTWKIISKDTWGEGFGGAWMGFNVPWGKYGIHGTLYPWQIGKANASKGCIRMKNSDVKELYKIVPHGTIVTIVHDNQPFRVMESGDIGSDVLEVQKALRKLGYYNGGADGQFGTGLKQGVKRFQQVNKIHPDGVIGRRTYDEIKRQLGLIEMENKTDTFN